MKPTLYQQAVVERVKQETMSVSAALLSQLRILEQAGCIKDADRLGTVILKLKRWHNTP